MILILLELWGLSSPALEQKELQFIRAHSLFSVGVDRPSVLTVCNEKLWVYSITRSELIEVHLESGMILGFHPLAPLDLAKNHFEVTALACRWNQPLLLANSKNTNGAARIYRFLPQASYFPFPHRGRVTDLFCQDRDCIAINQKIYQSSDLESWNLVDLPLDVQARRLAPSEVSGANEVNPFRFWQEDLTLAQAFLSRGAISKWGTIAVIDLFKTKIEILSAAKGNGDSEPGGQRLWQSESQWGKFGAWEGSFLAPQFLGYLAGKRLLVSDGKLRSLFVFSELGEYLGLLADSRGIPIRPQQLQGLAGDGRRLYLSQFADNRVSAWMVENETANLAPPKALEIRQNLLRLDSEVGEKPSEICLQCHDGVFSNQLGIFARPHRDHKASCTFCHSAHHDSQLPFQLLRPVQNLCEHCHRDRIASETNHIWQKKKRGGTCTDCHQYHSTGDHLLRQQPPNLCVECHANKFREHRSVSRLLWHESAQRLIFSEGKLECRTCHKTHINWRIGSFLVERDPVRVFCALCHGEKSDQLYRTYHKLPDHK